ncbi:Hypothetical predicted protein [Octopus vulgaris]|uniref:Uncharacterized protein n=1 Tax=Octopus vulgaris TaxID=6645 RepID=A0AA36BB17_OCTVU|nr:Hypothetical predicted protein [Octopus vulgaris]
MRSEKQKHESNWTGRIETEYSLDINITCSDKPYPDVVCRNLVIGALSDLMIFGIRQHHTELARGNGIRSVAFAQRSPYFYKPFTIIK